MAPSRLLPSAPAPLVAPGGSTGEGPAETAVRRLRLQRAARAEAAAVAPRICVGRRRLRVCLPIRDCSWPEAAVAPLRVRESVAPRALLVREAAPRGPVVAAPER